MIELNGNWHKIENQKEVFTEIQEESINFDVFVRRGNNVCIFVENGNTEQIYIVIQVKNTKLKVIYDDKEKAIGKLFYFLDQNNIDYLPLTNQKILEKLTDIDYHMSNLVNEESLHYDYRSNFITEELKNLISQIKKELPSKEIHNV